MLFPIPKGGSTGSQFKTYKTEQLNQEIRTDEIKMQVWLINTIWKDILCLQLNTLQSLLMISTYSPYSHISSDLFLFIWEEKFFKGEGEFRNGTRIWQSTVPFALSACYCAKIYLIWQLYGESLSSQSIFWAPPGFTAWEILYCNKWAFVYIKSCGGTIW